ncbi:hypothetical protein DPMN_123637 [Dreissena polymorpha]|uniref:Uncharacterized protein n=1 Tax=Dreissena polymorpha TaxID=45954 RepID=A0A9D4JT27_DREPO|nr:hypothetical protein DPMN_123637 [Dreissena polymorpha]
MIICGRSQNPFLPSCCALGQERIFRAPADDHALENVYYPYINRAVHSGRNGFFERPQMTMPSKTCIIPILMAHCTLFREHDIVPLA